MSTQKIERRSLLWRSIFSHKMKHLVKRGAVVLEFDLADIGFSGGAYKNEICIY